MSSYNLKNKQTIQISGLILQYCSATTLYRRLKNCMRHWIDIDISTIYDFAEGDKHTSRTFKVYLRTFSLKHEGPTMHSTLLLHSVTVESYFHPRSSACCIEYKWLDRIPAAVIRLRSAAVNFWCRENPGQSSGFEADTTQPCHHISFIQSSG